MAGREGAPWVPIPERLDRRLRLGPFPSGHDALKFVAAAAVGAVVSLSVAVWAGVPIVAVGAIIALWRPDGEGLDERLAALVRWWARRFGAGGQMSDPQPSPSGPGTTLRLPDGRRAAVLRTAGVPLAFLPPAELAHQFECYRELLRSIEGGCVILSTSVPIHGGSVAPASHPLPLAERSACDGYDELVTLLCRRRSVRRVLIVLAQELPDAEGVLRLEGAVELLRERLADLGIRSDRLRDRHLSDAARRLGWSRRAGER